MRKKAPKVTKTGPRKRALSRTEWDFSSVPKSAIAAVCMREYSKECLHAPAMRLAHSTIEQIMVDTLPDGKRVMDSVWRGLEQRAQVTPSHVSALPPLFEVTSLDCLPATPIPMLFTTLAINWGDDNKSIKTAFDKWLQQKRRTELLDPSWIDVVFRTIHNSLKIGASPLLYDYVDMAESLERTKGSLDKYLRKQIVLANSAIAAIRALSGTSKGRGDSKQSLLTDLAVYRLHRAGYGPQEISSRLGNSRLKFYDAALINRAKKNALRRTAVTLASATTCEFFSSFILSKVFSKQTQPSEQT